MKKDDGKSCPIGEESQNQVEKDLGRKIVFMPKPEVGRVFADCGDVFNWLLDYDKKVAEKFQKKYIVLLPNLKII